MQKVMMDYVNKKKLTKGPTNFLNFRDRGTLTNNIFKTSYKHRNVIHTISHIQK